MADGLYIGKVFSRADTTLGEPFVLDPGDLTTHGIIIGMTGSGKTGLSVGMIEEALRARIPVIVIDPKGDMGNLALAFDRLAPEQFEPWIDRDLAGREGKTTADVAGETAATWQKGLADWGLGAEDVAAYAASHRTRVYTPGATAGIPLNLIDSLDAPEGDFEENEEAFRDEIDAIVTALLGFVKIDADPISSREYILLFSLIERSWRNGETLNLEGLIGQVANPPLAKVGALPIDMFYPQKDRTALMFALNNLVASPPFEVWRQGVTIDIEKWVRSEDGVPNLSIVYTAHLDDEERIFITALILNKLKTWMRKQPGTSELRLLFYMDEIFGYFPPTANPPTKKPLLTLLKQARAYGVGVLLATQNPVDLDYKGLANMGFWAIGRLQTERDQDRVRQGVEAALDDAGMGESFSDLIAGVQKRVFLVHDIHRKHPELVHSRFVMSYLRGPITREEIRLLPGEAGVYESSRGRPAKAAGEGAASPSAAPRRAEPAAADGRDAGAGVPPMLPPPFKPYFYRRYGGETASPFLYVKAAVRYKIGAASTAESTHQLAFALTPAMTASELLDAKPIVIDERDLEARAGSQLNFAELPAFLATDGERAIERILADRLDDFFEVELIYDPSGKKLSEPGEDEYAFAARAGEAPGAAAKRRTLNDRLRKKRADLDLRRRDASGRKAEKWASVGTSILGSILSGNKRKVPGLGGVLSKSRMESTAGQRVNALEDEIAKLEADLAALSSADPSRFERRMVKPTKADTHIIKFEFVWAY